MRISEIAKENRPRERLLIKGAEALSDAEILALILQNGSAGENVIDMSNRLIATIGLEKLRTQSITELKAIKGIGEAKASKLIAAFELSKRTKAGRINEKMIRNSSDVAGYYIREFANEILRERRQIREELF